MLADLFPAFARKVIEERRRCDKRSAQSRLVYATISIFPAFLPVFNHNYICLPYFCPLRLHLQSRCSVLTTDSIDRIMLIISARTSSMSDEIQNFLQKDIGRLTKSPKSMQVLAEQWFWTVLVGFVICWMLEPILIRALIGFQGLEPAILVWQWAYSGQPTLLAWLSNVTYLLPGSPLIWGLIFSQLLVLSGLWGIWRLANKLLTPAAAFVATAMLTVLPSITLGGHSLSQSVLLFAIWPWIFFLVYQGFFEAKKLQWLIVAIGFNIACFASYLSFLPIFSIIVLSLLSSEARHVWRQYIWYLMWLIFLLGSCLPFFWLYEHPMSLMDAWHQSALQFSVFNVHTLLQWMMFVLGALLMLLVLTPFVSSLRHSHPISAHNKQWLLLTCLLPLLMAFLLAFFLSSPYFLLWQPMLWLQIGIVLMALWKPVVDFGAMRRFGAMLIMVHLGLLIVFNYLVVSGH